MTATTYSAKAVLSVVVAVWAIITAAATPKIPAGAFGIAVPLVSHRVPTRPAPAATTSATAWGGPRKGRQVPWQGPASMTMRRHHCQSTLWHPHLYGTGGTMLSLMPGQQLQQQGRDAVVMKKNKADDETASDPESKDSATTLGDAKEAMSLLQWVTKRLPIIGVGTALGLFIQFGRTGSLMFLAQSFSDWSALATGFTAIAALAAGWMTFEMAMEAGYSAATNRQEDKNMAASNRREDQEREDRSRREDRLERWEEKLEDRLF
jgi:hypothetical protein